MMATWHQNYWRERAKDRDQHGYHLFPGISELAGEIDKLRGQKELLQSQVVERNTEIASLRERVSKTNVKFYPDEVEQLRQKLRAREVEIERHEATICEQWDEHARELAELMAAKRRIVELEKQLAEEKTRRGNIGELMDRSLAAQADLHREIGRLRGYVRKTE